MFANICSTTITSPSTVGVSTIWAFATFFVSPSESRNIILTGIALLTALGLIGTGAQQVGLFDIESEPTSVNCAHDNVEVRDVKVDLNLKGVK
jgi:hypothetical protein